MKNGNASYIVALCRASMICIAFRGIRYHCVPCDKLPFVKKKMKRKGFTHRDIPIGMFRVEKKNKCIQNGRLDLQRAHTHTHISSGLHLINIAHLISLLNSRYTLDDFIRKDINRIIVLRK